MNIRRIKENSFIRSTVRKNPLLKKLIRPYAPSYYKGKTTHAYSLADYFGEKFGCTYIIDKVEQAQHLVHHPFHRAIREGMRETTVR